MHHEGRLVAIEGGEGAGKSTQAAMLARSLGAVLTREPGGSPLSERIRSLLLDPSVEDVAARAELHLMLAARAQHLSELIEPALARGSDVVVDRFSGSTLAYQGYGRGLPLPEVRQACELAAAGRWPDLSILLDVGVDAANARRVRQYAHLPGMGTDRIEAEDREFHARVSAGFRALAAEDPGHWAVVDGTQEREVVAREVAAVVRSRLGLGA